MKLKIGLAQNILYQFNIYNLLLVHTTTVCSWVPEWLPPIPVSNQGNISGVSFGVDRRVHPFGSTFTACDDILQLHQY